MTSLALLASLLMVSAADPSRIVTHEVESEYQARTTLIRVLTPDSFDREEKYRVVYVLPVEAGTESRYGNGLAEIEKHDLHNKHRAIFVAPTFSQLPWYADHATDLAIRQESHFLHVVVPFVDEHYLVNATAGDRLLLGFSKSGWGAWSLLLRNPDTFGRAAAWDAPMMMDRFGKYGNRPIFATQANFEKYRIETLLRKRGGSLGKQPRLILTGYGNFRAEHVGIKAVLDELRVPHKYIDGPKRKHDWHSGWVAEAVDLLFSE